jgi:TRAP-type C4-dicarboxylate transport system substrate-binding protein
MKFTPALLAIGAATFMAGASAQTVFTVSTWLPPTHTASVSQKTWCDRLETESSGRMKCNILPKGVVAAPGTFDAVRDGLADISYTVDGYTPGRFVMTQVAEFPFLGNSATETSVAYQRIYDKYFAPLGEHRGVKVLGVFTHGPGIIFNAKKPVTSAAEAASLKFRVGGGNINELAKAMGWNTTLKPAPESFELRRDGRHLLPRRIGHLVQAKHDQARHHLPGWPVQHQLRVHDEPGQIQRAVGARQSGGGQALG